MIALTSLALALAAAPSPAPAFQPKSRPYDAQHYKLEVSLEPEHVFKNKLTATLKATKAMAEFELDAYDITVEMLLVDNQAADFKLKFDPGTRTGTITIKPKKPIAAGKDAVVEISYTVKASTTSQDGMFVATETEGKTSAPGYFTHFEALSAQRFFPCNDQPSDKATSEVLAVVDEKYQVVSNGRKEKDEKFSEGGKNLRRVHWKQDSPHSPYLVALAIAQLEPVLVSEDVPSTLWVPPGTKDRAFIANDALKGLYNFQVGFTGTKYPWAKLDVVAVPGYFWGGMENTSVIFERTSRLLVDHKNDQTARTGIVGLLSHELAHQWFGDLVTCAWWNETWLNEGFATYLGLLTLDDYNNNEDVEISRARALVEGYFHQEDGPRAHPLVMKTATPDQAFDSVSYTKGANVLRMLELWLGTAEMKKVLKAYLEKHGGKAVTSDDFFKVVFETTKKEKELKGFKDSWLNKKGYPVIFPDTSFGNGKLTVKIRQQPNHPGEKGPFVFKLPIAIHREQEPAYHQDAVILVDKSEVSVDLDVPAAPQWIDWNKNFGALVKVNPSSLSEDRLVDAARHDPDPVWRLLATWQLLGELGNPDMKEETKPTDAALGAILDVLNKDRSPYVREAVLLRLAQTRFKELPKEFATPLLNLAKRPTDLDEDPVGYIRVRRAAMEALGRVKSDDGHKFLLDELAKPQVDINYLAGYAAGVARIGTPGALGTLRAALVTQKGRGMGYYERAATAVALSSSVDAVALLRDIFKGNAQNAGLARTMFTALSRNKELRESQDYASLVKGIVLDEATYPETVRSNALSSLDDVKYESAHQALEEIAAKATSEAIKASAKQVLDANFPAPPPPVPEKGKKKK
ncbi:MAG: M1 family aminopeptidase [Myxococcota bacterium]